MNDYDEGPRPPDREYAALPMVLPRNEKLCAALVRAQEAVLAVAKDSENKHGGYSYSSREAVAAAAKKAMAENGLAISLRGPIRMGGGRSNDDGWAEWSAILTHESGERETWPVLWPVDYCMKGMTREQRVGTAGAYAQKNLLIMELNIPRGVDDLDGQDQGRRDPPQQKRAAPARRGKRTQPKQGVTDKEAKRRRVLVEALKEESVVGAVKKQAKALGLGGSLLSQSTSDLERLHAKVFEGADGGDEKDAGTKARDAALGKLEKLLGALDEGPRQRIEGDLLTVDGELVGLDALSDKGIAEVRKAAEAALKGPEKK